MLIMIDNTGITIKENVQSEDHVRIGVLTTALWTGGVRRGIRDNHKPHVEFSINDCNNLLTELLALPSYRTGGQADRRIGQQ